MDQKILTEIIRNLQNKVRCPSCGHRFHKKDIKFRGTTNQVFLFEFGCPSCSTLLFAKVLVDKVKPQTIVRQSISFDDLIILHQQMKDFDGNFRQLFSK